MAVMERPQDESDHTRGIPSEILREILLRLPTVDVLRSSCVSKLWCGIVGDPSFRKLHAASAAPSESSESLLVSVNREPGWHDEASVFSVSSGKAMCHVAIPSRYSLTGICNGFLCFAIEGNYDQAPPVVCNPVTGETLDLPKPPPSTDDDGGDISLSHRFVLGFSGPPSNEYKVFRLFFPERCYSSQRDKTTYIAAYTLGDTGGCWCKYSYTSQFCPLDGLPAPVHIDGNLYVTVETGEADTGWQRTARMLVLNVATETCRTYRLPYNNDDPGYHSAYDMLADGFDLNGQMCLAVNVFDGFGDDRRKLQFWVMVPPGELEGKDDDGLHWSLRYSFDLGDAPFYFSTPRGAWLDQDGMLCYRHANPLWKYDTRQGDSSSASSSSSNLLLFDEKLQIPEAPSPPLPWSSRPSCQWNICGCYRPSFLSPLTFAVPPSQDEKGKKRQLEHDLLQVLAQSKRRRIKGYQQHPQ